MAGRFPRSSSKGNDRWLKATQKNFSEVIRKVPFPRPSIGHLIQQAICAETAYVHQPKLMLHEHFPCARKCVPLRSPEDRFYLRICHSEVEVNGSARKKPLATTSMLPIAHTAGKDSGRRDLSISPRTIALK